jgi:hypothetical protein
MKRMACMLSVLVLVAQAVAGEAPKLTTAPARGDSSKPVDVSDLARELQSMKAALKAQQAKIESLEQQLNERNQAEVEPSAVAPDARQPSFAVPTLDVNSRAASPAKDDESAPSVQHGTEVRTASLSSPPPTAVPAQASQATSTPPQQASNTINLAQGKLQIGAVVYADWGIYPQTGFGPAFLDTPHTYPGPGNDGYNAFNLNRTYVNFLYRPADWITFRVTPDIYRDTVTGNLNLRLKYGYGEFHKIFGGAMQDDNIRFGQQPNPLVDWDEALYGYRFVSLVPWNFISLSSTYTGVSQNGPIKGSNGKQYLDYQLGVFNNANFHQIELAENKTVMARASLYPMGASSRFDGLGLTGFIDYGYNNQIPSSRSIPVVRASALVHYMSPHNGAQIAFEYDFGRNAMSAGNLFGGSGSPTATFADANVLAGAILGMQDARQQGYDVFGHVNLGPTKWALFGLYQDWQPNTKVPDNPLDFRRVVAGMSYTFNKNVRLAVNSQDVLYKKKQFTYPIATLASFSPATATNYPAGVPNAVPPSVKAVFMNMEFTF